jgi:hypothetical protein
MILLVFCNGGWLSFRGFARMISWAGTNLVHLEAVQLWYFY